MQPIVSNNVIIISDNSSLGSGIMLLLSSKKTLGCSFGGRPFFLRDGKFSAGIAIK